MKLCELSLLALPRPKGYGHNNFTCDSLNVQCYNRSVVLKSVIPTLRLTSLVNFHIQILSIISLCDYKNLTVYGDSCLETLPNM